MNEIEVYVDENGRPQHLAVMNEHKHYLPGGSEPLHRAVCGSDTVGMSVEKKIHNDVKLPCHDCQEQLQMWRHIHDTPLYPDVVR